jgi:pyruvate carboxylase
MLKASWGGGGRGMRVIESDAQLAELLPVARAARRGRLRQRRGLSREAGAPRAPRRGADPGRQHGNLVHLFERDCTVQRRNQKVVERAPAVFLTMPSARRCARRRCDRPRGQLLQRRHGGVPAGCRQRRFYFIEVNPRIQVEHTVTECATGIDLVKAQIRIADGARIGEPESGVPPQDRDPPHSHALQCRITTEDPENNFIPDYGRITAYRSPAGFGVRLDAGTAYSGAVITRSYDSLLVKVTTWAPTPRRPSRACTAHCGSFASAASPPTCASSTRSSRTELRARRLHHALHRRDAGAVQLAGAARPRHAHPDLPGRHRRSTATARSRAARVPARLLDAPAALPPALARGAASAGQQAALDELGPERFAQWMLRAARAADRHHHARCASVAAGDAHAHHRHGGDRAGLRELLPQLFSVECWGGATFDVAMRFLKEDPWERLARLREAMPNLLLQMLLRRQCGRLHQLSRQRGALLRARQAAAAGIDLFRIFDSLNWVENMRVAIDAVLESGKLCEAAICYTGNICNPERAQVHARLLPEARARAQSRRHPRPGHQGHGGPVPAARRLRAGQGAEGGDRPAGALSHPRHQRHRRRQRVCGDRGRRRCGRRGDGFDERPDLAAQPRLDRRGAALRPARSGSRHRAHPHDVALLGAGAQGLRAFESDNRAGASEVYVHGMPGGQYTNLRSRRARSASTTRAGRRWRAPMPRSTTCSATSSR